MSVYRRVYRRSGIPHHAVRDFWRVNLTVQNPPIPNLPLLTAAGASPQSLFPLAITTLEVFGVSKLNLKVLANAIASLEIFGSLLVKQGWTLLISAIASLEAFGSILLNRNIKPTSIATLEVFGVVKLNLMLALFGVPTLEAFGNVTLTGDSGSGLSREGRIAIHIAIRIGIFLLCFL